MFRLSFRSDGWEQRERRQLAKQYELWRVIDVNLHQDPLCFFTLWMDGRMMDLGKQQTVESLGIAKPCICLQRGFASLGWIKRELSGNGSRAEDILFAEFDALGFRFSLASRGNAWHLFGEKFAELWDYGDTLILDVAEFYLLFVDWAHPGSGVFALYGSHLLVQETWLSRRFDGFDLQW